MAQGVGVRRLIGKALSAQPPKLREFRSGPWVVEIETWDGHGVAVLKHYGTKMLRFTLEYPSQIIDTWTGWGSVSDQTGVNAALRALGSPLSYSRDRRGGGPRINPRRRRRRAR